MRPLYFVNFTESLIATRTTEVKTFASFKDAQEFSKGKRGYISKYAEPRCTLKGFFGGFVPTASEQAYLQRHFS